MIHCDDPWREQPKEEDKSYPKRHKNSEEVVKESTTFASNDLIHCFNLN